MHNKYNKQNKSNTFNKVLSLLYKIKSNCEYLYLIQHRSQFNYQIPRYNPASKDVCPISTARMMVQMTYFLYACCVLNEDVWISNNPIFTRKIESNILQPQLIFYFAKEQMGQKQYQKLHSICKFKVVQSYKFNQRILQLISIIQNSCSPFFSLSSTEAIRTDFQKLMESIKNIYSKNSVIYELQKTPFFLTNSDLLTGLKCSLLYKINKNEKIIALLKKNKREFKFKGSVTPACIYKYIDSFLMQLNNSEIICCEKSSSREEKSKGRYLIGFVGQDKNNEKEFGKYIATFYTLDKGYQTFIQYDQIRNCDKNIYRLEYSVETQMLDLTYITHFEPNVQLIDLISAYASYIGFEDTRISIEDIETYRMPSQALTTKKFITFKAFHQIYKLQEPLTKLLPLLEHLTICAKLYMEVVFKRPTKNQYIIIHEYMKRLDHTTKLFVDRANNFYKQL